MSKRKTDASERDRRRIRRRVRILIRHHARVLAKSDARSDGAVVAMTMMVVEMLRDQQVRAAGLRIAKAGAAVFTQRERSSAGVDWVQFHQLVLRLTLSEVPMARESDVLYLVGEIIGVREHYVGALER